MVPLEQAKITFKLLFFVLTLLTGITMITYDTESKTEMHTLNATTVIISTQPITKGQGNDSSIINDTVTKTIRKNNEIEDEPQKNFLKTECLLEDFNSVNDAQNCIMRKILSSYNPARRQITHLDSWMARPISAKDDPRDCLYGGRKHLRFAPFDCYGGYGDWNQKNEFIPFMNEIINDLRYTFDYVLYDETMGTKFQYQFWYLMFYLKSLAIAIPDIIEISSAVYGLNRHYATHNQWLSVQRKFDDMKRVYNKLEETQSKVQEEMESHVNKSSVVGN